MRCHDGDHSSKQNSQVAALDKFVTLFSTLYLGFGCASPYLPLFFSSRGLAPAEVGSLVSLAIIVRLFSGPIAGATADRFGALPTVLSICCLSAAAFAALLAMSHSYTSLLFVSLFLAAALAPTTTLADALALRNVSPGRDGSFRYGAVRGAGSAAFIVGSLLAGEAIGVFGTSSVLLGQGAFLILAAFFAAIVPHPKRELGRAHHKTNAFIEGLGLARNRPFRLVVIIAAIVLGSHAMHDSFAMISWKAAGISPVAGSVLWSESVAAEVFVFVIAGPKLLRKVHPSTAIAIGAVAAAVRWTVLAQPSHFLALALAEPLHGLSFALLHLACMRILVRVTPSELAGTAQSTYAFGIGASSALLTFAAGFFYEHFGPIAFLAMAVLALISLPLVVCLNRVFEMAPPHDLTERMG